MNQTHLPTKINVRIAILFMVFITIAGATHAAGTSMQITTFNEGTEENGWIQIQGPADGISVDPHPAHVDDGSGIKLASSNETPTRAVKTLSTPLDLSNYQSLYLEFYADKNENQVQKVGVQFVDTIHGHAFFHCVYLTSPVNPGNTRMKQTVMKEDCSSIVQNGESPNWNSITQIRVLATARQGQSVHVTFDRLSAYKNLLTRGKILLSFDDGYKSHNTAALPILNKNNLKGTSYVIMHGSSSIGTGKNYMTTEQVQELYDAGWDIGSHASPSLTRLDPDAAAELVKETVERIDANGWTRASEHFAYPRGEYSQDLIDRLKPYISTGRTVEDDPNPASFPNPYAINAWSIDSTDSVDSLKQWVDRCAANKDACILTFHNLVDTPGNIKEYNKADFEKFAEYVALLDQENTADIVTISQLYQTHHALTTVDPTVQYEGSKWGKVMRNNGRPMRVESRVYRFNQNRIILANYEAATFNGNVTLYHSRFDCGTLRELRYTSQTGKYQKTYGVGEFSCNAEQGKLVFQVNGIEPGENNLVYLVR